MHSASAKQMTGLQLVTSSVLISHASSLLMYHSLPHMVPQLVLLHMHMPLTQGCCWGSPNKDMQYCEKQCVKQLLLCQVVSSIGDMHSRSCSNGCLTWQDI